MKQEEEAGMSGNGEKGTRSPVLVAQSEVMLRDLFAGFALVVVERDCPPKQVALSAYELADAMLEARRS